jgi:uncharacterized membrane-anchored protein YitT (DUF2179 family)
MQELINRSGPEKRYFWMTEAKRKKIDFYYSPLWNLFLITSGSVIWALGVKAIVVHHQFITGGLFGVSLLFYYSTDLLSPGITYALLNIPLFAVGWIMVGRRFFFYSLYAMALTTIAYELISVDLGVKDSLHAAIAGGLLCGAGSGIILRSLGSGGGLDVMAVIFNQKYNLGLGRFHLIFNSLLFFAAVLYLDIDLIIASLILAFINAGALEYVMALFNQRKIAYIISDENIRIADAIIYDLQKGATFIRARGAYTRRDRDIVMTITNNVQLKHLEQTVFKIDPHALFIVENTFNVIGSGFGRRRLY